MNRDRSGSRAAESGGGRRRGAGADAAPAPHGPARSVPAGSWLFKGHDGRLTAYAPARDGLHRWTEPPSGQGPWPGPDLIGTPGWCGRVDMAQTSEGYVHFAALRQLGTGAPEVAFATQFQTGRGVTDWRSLGVPTAPDGPAGDPLVAGPVIVANQVSGTVHVIVSLRTGGILRRSRNAAGAWGGWKTVSPDPYTGDLTAVMPRGGKLEILGVGPDRVDRWVGVEKGRFELWDRIGTPVAGATPTALETGPKRATYFWRYPGDSSLVAWRPQGRGAQDNGLLTAGGAGGSGRPGVARARVGDFDCTVLAQTGAHGGIEVTAYVTENEGYGTWWAPLGGEEAHAPQVAVDGAGRIVVAALDGQGRILLARQDSGGQGLAFGPWSRVG
ncbi:hypothetical protein OG204_29610 [Streptomyces sp. NBC_01387]|uniref:hypothetical protein n=1 Tax=unclassified Streptomyces TaxID=2593676 RepID=UPI00224DDE17|nr:MULTISPECIES: hypothetical protein [unclassified Streptomyces]MCX4547469.1 hypothetical protein [Streptomyces sp. NBC_01500]WSC19191.1 hypothetical protein OIE60_05615 [Streptomyces sp. NBC_01766]WSV53215.1 hypothetical protein OG282_05580 [Streptomyces sp. NBC_01014]